MSVIDKSEYVKWLSFEIDLYGKYHNHKETMAWVATAFYVPGIILIGHYVGQLISPYWLKILFLSPLISLLILLALYLVFIFVNMQFNMRWEAADGVKALRQLWAELNNDGELPRQDEWLFTRDKDIWP